MPAFFTISHLDVFGQFRRQTVHLTQANQWFHNGLALEFQAVPDTIHGDQAEGYLEQGKSLLADQLPCHR